jgi:hypothetical protein
MPINITNQANQITKSHTAERLEINLLSANEDVKLMQLKVYFNVDTFFNNEKIAATHWDNTPLIFDCKDDPELEAAMLTIQNRIGTKRYEQVTSPETDLTN